MPRIPSISNVTDQVVELLREGMLAGRWQGTLPGRDQLAGELGVSHTTMEAAMRRLAKEGLLVSQGAGKRRRIVLPAGKRIRRHCKVRVLAYEADDRCMPHMVDLMNQLNKHGFSAKIAEKSLLELDMDSQRIARFVRKVQTDAWIVTAGSREVVEWFCNQPVPAYAYFGAKSGLPIAGCGVNKDIQPLIRNLVQLGHKRIVLLDRYDHAESKPSLLSQIFFNSLQSEGIAPGPYHLPVWGYHPEGLHRCLESLFRATPPTALISEEATILLAARDHLARRGIIAPRDVSLICLDQDPSFAWCEPLVDHYSWDHDPIVRRVVRWAKNVALGKQDRRQTDFKAQFVEGGTIGPVPKDR